MGARLASLSSVVEETTPSGLVLVTKVDFATSGAVTIDNCFTSKYRNYWWMIDASASAGAVPMITLRAGGTPATTNYNHQVSLFDTGTTLSQTISQSSMWTGRLGTSLGHIEGTLSGPAIADITWFMSRGHWDAGSTFRTEIATGFHSTATAYDGLTFTPNAGTFTGTLSIFGYRAS